MSEFADKETHGKDGSGPADHSLKETIKSTVKAEMKAAAKELKRSIKDLSPAQRDLLLRKLAKTGQASSESGDRIPRLSDNNSIRTPSFVQERNWFLDQLSPRDPALNIPGAIRLRGDLSLDCLIEAFEEILRRHEALRTKFPVVNGQLVPMVRSPSRPDIQHVVLSHLDPAQREARCMDLYAEEVATGFDLANDSLLRITLAELDTNDHFLLFTMHNISADGMSIGILLQELATLYSARVTSQIPSLPELKIRYSDFAAWQRDRLVGDTLDNGLAYWREQLENLGPVLELPSDQLKYSDTADGRRDLKGATSTLRIGADLKQELDTLSRREGTTLFVTLLSAFMVQMMRLTQREDILVGVPTSGRTTIETENLIGSFLNTLPIRANITPKMIFRQALGVVKKSFYRGLEHSDIPFDKIVHDVAPERSMDKRPLIETVFNFTPSPPRSLELPNLMATLIEPPDVSAKFSTEMFIAEWQGTLELKLLYPSARYSKARMDCFLDQYVTILKQVVLNADCLNEELSLVTDASLSLLPNPQLGLDQPAQQSVAHRLAELITEHPERTAVCQGEFCLSYAELGTGMSKVATLLREQGLQPGQVVAVAGENSPEVVVCMAGVLLARGVLLTLSKDLPEQRRIAMLQESNAKFLLDVGGQFDSTTEPGLKILGVNCAGSISSSQHIDVTGLDDRISPRDFLWDETVVGTEARTQIPAYIFFTSGSTGTPKGVLGTHAGLAHWLKWQRETFNVDQNDRCGQLTGLSFDVVLRDVFLPLTSGALLVLPTREERASGQSILEWLGRRQISLLHSVPTVAEMLLLSARPQNTLAALKRLFFAGEPLTASLISRWRSEFSQAGEIINLYGPTETTLAKCFYRIPATPFAGIQPVGNPLPDTQALVLTADRRRCGIGEPGEIAIRTPFRSLGYINSTEENQKRFIANPFANNPDDILYLTGDCGTHRADGLLEFRGRVDDQVKIRGVRVEPTEITTVLQRHPDVATCAVIPREHRDTLILVGYVVLADGAREDAGALHQFLEHRLPSALVPSAFVFLGSMPLNSNQKLDRSRLPAPSGIRPSLESRYVAPRNSTELRMVQIWEDLLEVHPIGVKDNFFQLGGHSLLALNLLMQIERDLGIKVPLPALFEGPTIENLVANCGPQQQEWSRLVSLWAGKHPLNLFLVHPGGGILWNYISLVRCLRAPVTVYGLQAKGLDGNSSPHETIEQMAEDYAAEIRRVQPDGPYLLAGHSFGGLVAFEMMRQLQQDGHDIGLLVMFDTAYDGRGSVPAEMSEQQRDAHSLAQMLNTIERFTGTSLGLSFESLCDLAVDEQIERVVQAITQDDSLRRQIGSEMLRNLLTVSKIHSQAGRNYHPLKSAIPMTLIRADEGTSADCDAGDESLGWNTVTTGPIRILRTPGDHVTMLSEPNVNLLANQFRDILEEAIQNVGPC